MDIITMKQNQDSVRRCMISIIICFIIIRLNLTQFALAVTTKSSTRRVPAESLFIFNNKSSIITPNYVNHVKHSGLVKIDHVTQLLPLDKRLDDGSQSSSSGIHIDRDKDNTTCPLYCKCNQKHRSVLCNGVNLTWIPTIPFYANFLQIRNANLKFLNGTSFKNITNNIELNSLALLNCSIHNISKDAFKGIPLNLKTLDLSNNQITIDQLVKSLCAFAYRNLLRELILNDMNLEHIPEDFFQCWHGSALKALLLMANSLKQFSGDVIHPLKNLEILNLKVNSLTAINKLESLRSIHTLDLSSNRFAKLPNFVSRNGSKLLPNLHTFAFKYNYLQSISAINFRGLDKVRDLDLEGNQLRKLRNNIISVMPNLKYVSFKANQIHTIASFAFNHSGLRRLNFGDNTLHFSNVDANNLFKFSPHLKVLILTNNHLNIDDLTFKRIFSPLKWLERLLIDNTGLQVIPTTLLEALSYVEELMLSENAISYWKPDIFLPAKKLSLLYLNHCRIQIINKTTFPQNIWDKFKKVNFEGNPFSCTCDLLWFRNWLDTTDVKVVNWPYGEYNYKCGSPPVFQGKALRDYHPTKESCTIHNNIYIILGASLAGVFVLTVIIAIVSYRYRWHIRYFCAVIKAKRRNYNTLPVLVDYTYDAFVIYSSIDRAWVIENLIPIVEYREGYKLCVQDRDFTAGRLIIDNIVDAMENSRKIIIILSNNFAKSEWCKWETAMAMHKFTDTDSVMLVLITIDAISPENLNRSLTQLLQRTYVDWEGTRNCRDLFWNQILSTLKLPEENE